MNCPHVRSCNGPTLDPSYTASYASTGSNRAAPIGRSVTFLFFPFENVRIKAIDTEGFVTTRMNNETGENEYKVVYWLEGKRNSDWFFEFELELKS